VETIPINLEKYRDLVKTTDLIKVHGKVTRVVGLIIESEGPAVKMGDICHIFNQQDDNYDKFIVAEVVGFRENKVLLMPLGEMSGIGPGDEVRATGKPMTIKVGPNLLGRIIDGLGNPIDGKGPLDGDIDFSIYQSPPNPFTRPRIKEPISTGIRSIDTLLTLGKGQRVGIFAGSGVGKSTLMGMVARYTSADVNVISLVGERGRELMDFLERDLGHEGLKRSVIVCATSDQPALVRMKGAYVGTAVAEYFREQGYDVMFMMDSVTRFAMAQREVGLAIGEPPATRGYTPSVFALLPKLLERSGTSPRGSITGIYTVLVEGDDMNEPIADQVRSILDGHIVLSRAIAAQNRYPSIDVMHSVSRLFSEITVPEHKQAAGRMREVMATYQEKEDLINIGAYKEGTNQQIDYAIKMIQPVYKFLCQKVEEYTNYESSVKQLIDLMSAG